MMDGSRCGNWASKLLQTQQLQKTCINYQVIQQIHHCLEALGSWKEGRKEGEEEGRRKMILEG